MFFRKLRDAQNPYTDFVTLREMANHPSSKIRAALAANKNLQTYLHPQFAEDRNEKVRLALTGNPNLSLEAWEILKKDKSEAVRTSLKKQ